jgi:predicted nucleic acid-binding Zn ribbon protein
MGKLKNRPFEECVYKHCNNVFRPKREAQRFCSQRCREAYRYDIKRAASGTKKARKKHLVLTLLGSAEKGAKRSNKTVLYKEGVDPYFVVKGFGVETPSTSDIDPELLRDIVRLERNSRG